MAYIVTSRMRRNNEPRWPFAVNWSSPYARGLVGAFAFWDQQGRWLEHVKRSRLTYNGTIIHTGSFFGATYTSAGVGNYIDVGRPLLVAEDNYTLFSDAWFSTVQTDRQGFYFGQYNRNSSYDFGLYVGGGSDNPVFFATPTGPTLVQGAANSLDTLRRQYHSGVYRRNTASTGVQGRIWSDVASVGLSNYGNTTSPDVATTSNYNFLVAGGFSAISYVPTTAHKGGLVWNRALPAAEIEALHAPNWPGLVFEEYGRTRYFIGSTGVAPLSIDSAVHAHAADSPSLAHAYSVSVNESAHAHTADSPSIAHAYSLTVAEASHAHTADSPTLAAAYILTVDESGHAHTADAVTLTVGGESIAPADATHGHTADSPNLAHAYSITVDATTHAHTADAVSVAHAYALTVAESLHAHVADAPSLAHGYTVIVSSALHAHLADAVSFPGQSVITPDGNLVLVMADDTVVIVMADVTTIEVH